jgi:cbb3-type cytochrome oxidase subunit 3
MVTVGFAALVLWVYWPTRRNRLEALGRIPLDDADERNNKEKDS